MKLLLRGHTERYALEQLQMSLFPDAAMEYTETPFPARTDGAVSTLSRGKTWLTATARLCVNGKVGYGMRRLRCSEETVRLRRRILQQSYYLAALQILERVPPWGGMAGVRPSKLTTKLLLSGKTAEEAQRELEEVYFVSPSRAALSVEASCAAVEAAALLSPRDISLYIGIPFCPTRCAYCSFISSAAAGKGGKLIPAFFDALLKETDYTADLLSGTPFRIRTVYFGGGTPTILTAAQLEALMQRLHRCFDLSNVVEYTVEGGRPDTLDREKLEILYRYGCDRISINPQTMSDRVLKNIGRLHSAEDIRRSYREAREIGFTGINMDLLAGLPGDDPGDFRDSLSQVIALAPSNITVHTLALKKGADLFTKRGGLVTVEAMSEMVEDADRMLRSAGYRPYYLYRQKYMSGSFENIGWCKPGYTGLYNIYMMEELQSILALGGGGMNKVCFPDGKIERFHNPKYPDAYLSNFETVLEQKRRLIDLMCGSLPENSKE